MDHRIEAFVLELVDARQRSPRRGVFAILAPVPLFRIEIVVRRARLEDVEERVAFVLNPLFDRRYEMFDVVRVAAADPCRAGGEGEPDWVDGLVDVRMGEGLRLDAELEGRRGLALRQPVDAVVVDDVQHVQVPAAGVHEVSAADSEPVAVAAETEDLELRIRELNPGRVRERPAVQRVDPVRLHIVDRLRGTPDPRDDRDAVGLHLELGQGHLDRPQDAEVPAPWTPVIVDFGRKVRRLQDLFKSHGSTPSFAPLSRGGPS